MAINHNFDFKSIIKERKNNIKIRLIRLNQRLKLLLFIVDYMKQGLLTIHLFIYLIYMLFS